jgi:MFS family permease
MSSSPIWGILIDRHGCFQQIMIFGTILCLIFPLLIGPSPILPIKLSIPLLCVSFVLQGLAITSLHTPSFKFCIEGAKFAIFFIFSFIFILFRRNGFAETETGTTGCISGLLNGAIALGAFIGVTGGGFLVQWIGFEHSSTVAGFIQIIPVNFP